MGTFEDVHLDELWNALFDPAHSRSALVKLKRRADAEDPKAQWYLANWLSFSKKNGYESPRSRAAAWLLRAAEHGYLPAMVDAAHYLETTGSPDADPARAEALYRSAARRGSSVAAWALGINAEAAFGESADLSRAYHWFRRAAELDLTFAWKPGEYALAGLVESKWAKEGLRVLKRAASSGKSAEAEFYVGLQAYLGIACPVDVRTARKWFKRAASNPTSPSTELGERCAHALLGRQLAFSPKTRKKGIKHLEIAAEAGLPLAQVDRALALLASGRKWDDCSHLIRKAVALYEGPWRQPGTVWLGVERLTVERIRLAFDLLGQSSRCARSDFGLFVESGVRMRSRAAAVTALAARDRDRRLASEACASRRWF